MVMEMFDYQLPAAHGINLNSESTKMTDKMDYPKVGRTVRTALLKAQFESRIIIGLSNAIRVLSTAPENTLMCLMALPDDDDSATHIHEVLLEAFCYEHDIYVIKVDCPLKLSRILGRNTMETCCLIQKTTNNKCEEELQSAESRLVDFCEACWDRPERPIIELPTT